MTRKDILKHLIEWERVQKALDAQLDKLYDLTGSQPDSPLFDAIYAAAEAYTESVARIVGDDTRAMEWWQFECGFGERPLQAAIHGKPLKLISNLKQLAALIAE